MNSQLHQTILAILTARMHGGHTQTVFPSESTIVQIINMAKKLFNKEPSLLELDGNNFTVVGDIHGNIDDLLRIFEKRGYPPQTNYLFLGDYVDRGSHSPEVIILLFCLKILYPQSLFMIRGNHECESVTTVYGFRRDCNRRFSQRVYWKFMKAFQYLPFAAVINEKYFCVHGGLSPQLESLDDIIDLDKPMVSADSEIAHDIVWSDPLEDADGFQPSDRGTGFFFNNKKLNQFLKANSLKKMIRSHESCMAGIEKPLVNCITVFSNTDYCGMGNTAAVVVIEQIEQNDEQETDTDGEEEDELTAEYFNPLTEGDLEMRRVLIPEWIFTEMTENSIPMKEPCVVSPQDLLDALSGPPLNLF